MHLLIYINQLYAVWAVDLTFGLLYWIMAKSDIRYHTVYVYINMLIYY